MEIVTKDNIADILQAGESRTVEFKARVSASNRFLPRIINSLANTEGGIIVFGYDEKKQTVIGSSRNELEKIRNVIFNNKLEEICDAYSVQYEEKLLIIVQVQKSESLVILGGGAYIRKENTDIAMTSKDIVKKLETSLEGAIASLTKEDIEQLENKTEQIIYTLLQAQKDHERELKSTCISNWFFCILSAFIGYGLGKFF